jgi:hypothetical protein
MSRPVFASDSTPEPDPDMDEQCAKCGHTYGNHFPGGCTQPGLSCPCSGFLHRFSEPPQDIAARLSDSTPEQP